LFFIEHASRRVHVAGCTTNPDERWVTQQARNLGLFFAEQQIRFLIRDRDSKYSGPLDEIFRGERIRIVQTPIRAPKANAIAERFVRTVRAECLDWLLILNRRHLERVLRVYADHYNTQRPHRALDLQPPDPAEPVGFRNSVSVRGFSSSTRSARRVGFAGLSGVDQPRPTLRGPADESSAFDVDPADLVFARARETRTAYRR